MIVHIASEYASVSQAGGLADAVAGLAVAQARAGRDVTVFLPLHRDRQRWVDGRIAWAAAPCCADFSAAGRYRGGFGFLHADGVRLCFVACDELYDRPGIYGEHDDAIRYQFLCRVALAVLDRAGAHAEVLHCHDWPAAQALLHLRHGTGRRLSATGVLTLHNTQHQGVCAADYPSGLDEYGHCLHGGGFNLIAGAARVADAITTVSPRFAAELAAGKHCFGLEGVLGRVTGVLNGIDYGEFRLPTDKERCKSDYCRAEGLDPELPLIACVTRACWQKGTDLLPAALAAGLDANLSLLACGSAGDLAPLESLAGTCCSSVRIFTGAPERERTLRLLSAADFVLMPSRFEPCGLVQMQGMAMGCIPVATDCGGLADTITYSGSGQSGIRIESATPEGVRDALLEALSLTPAALAALRRNAAAARFTWDRAAAAYETVYRSKPIMPAAPFS